MTLSEREQNNNSDEETEVQRGSETYEAASRVRKPWNRSLKQALALLNPLYTRKTLTLCAKMCQDERGGVQTVLRKGLVARLQVANMVSGTVPPSAGISGRTLQEIS